MLKHEKIVLRMTLEQRIKFIVSKNYFASGNVDDFEFPSVSFSYNPLSDKKKFYTALPSKKLVACSWNEELMKQYGKVVACENNTVNEYVCPNTFGDTKLAAISDDPFLTASFNTAYVNGLKEGKAHSVMTISLSEESKQTLKEIVMLPYDYEVINASPETIIVNSVDEINHFLDLHFKGEFYGTTNDPANAVKLLNNGCGIILTDDEHYNEIVNHIYNATNEFNKSHGELVNSNLALIEFNARLNAGEIVDEKVINEAADRVVDLLLSFDDNNNEVIEPLRKAPGNDEHEVLFDEVGHTELSYQIAKESIVLLKNKDNILPFNEHGSVAIIGDYASNQYELRITEGNETFKMTTILEMLPDYPEIKTIGHAHGYLLDVSNNGVSLVDAAIELAEKADISLVFLTCNSTEHKLTDPQINLVNRLVTLNKKIVLVVISNELVEIPQVEKIAGLVYAFHGGSQLSKALLEVLTGRVNPSGKLCETYPVVFESAAAKSALPIYNQDVPVLFPFGYGLSYTTFSYSHLKADEEKVSFTITNTGEYDGYEVSQLYVSKDNSSHSLHNMSLRGYGKVFLRKGESLKMVIYFDDKTFAYFDEKENCYGIEGGNYNILVASSSNNVKLKGVLKLNKYLDNAPFKQGKSTLFDSEGKAIKRFANTKSKKEFMAERRGLSFHVRMLIAHIVMVYFLAMMVFLLYYINVYTNGRENIFEITPEVYPVFGGIALILIVMLIVLIRIQARRVHYSKLDKNDKLTKAIEEIQPFNEVTRETYIDWQKPVKVEEVPVEEAPVEEENKFVAQEVVEETVVEETPAEEEFVETYDASFENVEAATDFNTFTSYNEIYTKFVDYCKSKDILVEPASARALFAALCSSRLISISSANKELLPEFVLLLNEYFGSLTRIQNANDNWSKEADLLWFGDDRSHVPSQFSNALNFANNNPQTMTFAIVNNVSMKNINSYFARYISHATNPTMETRVRLNESVVFTIPRNLRFIIIPSEENYLEIMPYNLASCSFNIDVVIRRENYEGEPIEFKRLSYDNYKDLVKEGRSTYYLPEECWKKFDELEEQLGSVDSFKIGNKNILQIERFTAMFLECGGDNVDTVDSVLSYKIIPMIKSLRLYKADGGEKTIKELLTKVFGDDSVVKALKVLAKMEVAEETPVEEVPTVTEEVPVEAEPVVEEQPAEESVVEEVPTVTEEVPVEAEPVVEEQPAEETVVEEVPTETEEAPVETEAVVEEQPAEESVVEETPVTEEVPVEAEPAAEEQPAEETVVEETPVTEEAPVEAEPVVEEQPVEESVVEENTPEETTEEVVEKPKRGRKPKADKEGK